MNKLGYYLAVAYYDVQFKIFFIILALKLILFTHLAGLGINSFFPSFGAILMTLSISLLIKNVILKSAYLQLLNLLYSLIFLSHSMYLRYFGDYASVYNLSQLHMLPSIADMVADMIGKELLFIMDIMALPFLVFKLKQKRDYNGSGKICASAILLLLGLYCNAFPLVFYLRSDNNFFESIYYRPHFVVKTGVITYQVTDVYYYLMTRVEKVVSQDLIDSMVDWRKKRNESLEKNNLTGIGKGMNLIVIQVESLQNFVIGREYNGAEITPNLNSLAREGIYFKNIYDQTAAGNSSDSTLLVNSSIYPSRKGAASFLYPQNCFDSLPKILRENGYATATMHAYKGGFWNRETFEKSLGFGYQFYEDDYAITEEIGWGLSDRSFFSQSIEKIKRLPTPFYAYLTTLSSHGPFTYITSDIDGIPLQDLEGKPLGNYLRSMHYVDSAIGEFLHKLTESESISNTVIVIYGDHRARLPGSELQRMGISDIEENRKIPLLISIPKRWQRDERDNIGGLIDVAPTLCNILGIDMSEKFFMGKDLAGRDSFVAFRDGSCMGCMEENFGKKQLVISDLVLEKDIIPLINNGCLNEQHIGLEGLIAHAGGGIDGLAYTNSLEALNYSYGKGFRFLEIDLEWTSDRHLVLVHDWDESISRLFGVGPGTYSLSEFKNLKMVSGLTQMTLDDLADWLEKHPDAHVVTDIKRDVIAALIKIVQRHPGLKDRIIPQIYRFREYGEVRRLGFDAVILTLYVENYSDDRVLEFLEDHGVTAVTMPVHRAQTALPLKLKSRNVFVYAHTVNDPDLKNKLKSNGVDGFYTDFLN